MKRLQVSLVLCLLVLLAGAGRAQSTATWTGLAGPTGGNYTFEQTTNWLGNVIPSSGNHLVFGPGPTTNLLLSNPFTAGDITFSGIQNGFHLVGATTLTLTGSVTTTADSQYWGLFSLPVSLAAGNHIYTAGGNASIYHFGAVSGTGGITKEGANGLYMTESSTYSGGTTLNGGKLAIAYSANDVRLGNDFVFGANIDLDTSQFVIDDEAYSLILGNSDGSTMAPVTGVTTVNFNLTGLKPVHLTGEMQDGDAATTYTFANEAGSGGYRVSGYGNNYTGGTLVKSGAIVIFDSPGSIPLSSTITSQPDGYVGIGDPT
ncbi:MAG TPA: hypothetical protein VHN79_08485, partial [Lacunisphaera sp.]|nr:hypothetical protein [Lacunisphaera sp.]